MTEYNVTGALMDDESAEIMRYFGWNDNVCPGDIRALCEKAAGDDLRLYFNSDGGSLIAGTEIYSILRGYSGKVAGHIQSRAASAATVAMMGCGRITSEPVSLFCAHNPTTYAEGESGDMRHTARELDNIKDSILAAYLDHEGIKATYDELSALMDKNIWITAEKALEYGFIDEIIRKNEEKTDSGILLNAAGMNVALPTNKMRDEYRRLQNEKRDIENRKAAEKAFLEIYR